MNKFKHLTNLPALPDFIIEDALKANYEIQEFPHRIRGDASLFTTSKFFKMFEEHFGRPNVNYLKTFPNSLYDWHTDRKRLFSVNWVIKSNPKAATFFRSKYDHELLTANRIALERNIVYWQLEEVDYIPLKPTILNVQEEHAVYNNYPEERIIMSLSRRDRTYEEMSEWFSNLTIDSYF